MITKVTVFNDDGTTLDFVPAVVEAPAVEVTQEVVPEAPVEETVETPVETPAE